MPGCENSKRLARIVTPPCAAELQPWLAEIGSDRLAKSIFE
jgi:hypothetical protein